MVEAIPGEYAHEGVYGGVVRNRKKLVGKLGVSPTNCYYGDLLNRPIE